MVSIIYGFHLIKQEQFLWLSLVIISDGSIVDLSSGNGGTTMCSTKSTSSITTKFLISAWQQHHVIHQVTRSLTPLPSQVPILQSLYISTIFLWSIQTYIYIFGISHRISTKSKSYLLSLKSLKSWPSSLKWFNIRRITVRFPQVLYSRQIVHRPNSSVNQSIPSDFPKIFVYAGDSQKKIFVIPKLFLHQPSLQELLQCRGRIWLQSSNGLSHFLA